MKNLYLIPTPIASENFSAQITPYMLDIIKTIRVFIAETPKMVRSFLKKANYPHPLTQTDIFQLNEHTTIEEYKHLFGILKENESVGLMSDAGCPAIADPGAKLIYWAHQNNINVVPLVGPSAILLALMASGLNGQSFAFNGYLPKEKKERIKKIKFFERQAKQYSQTQVFIETPYRNQQLLEALIQHLEPDTCLCIAVNLLHKDSLIVTQKVSQWRKKTFTIQKVPSVFMFL